MRNIYSIFLFLVSLLSTTQLSAQSYAEHDKEQLRKFLRQEQNFKNLGLSNADTLTWGESEAWILKLAGFNWIKENKLRYLTRIEFSNVHAGDYTKLTGNFDFSGCEKLTSIHLYEGKAEKRIAIDSIMLAGCENLVSVRIYNTSTKAIDFTDCTELESISLEMLGIASLDLESCIRASMIDVTKCKNLSEVKLGDKFGLKLLHIEEGTITDIDVSRCEIIEDLSISSTLLNKIDLSRNEKLRYLNLTSNKLDKDLDLKNNVLISYLYLSNNDIRGINLPKFNNLSALALGNCNLDGNELNTYIKKYIGYYFETLFLSNNNLSDIDLSNLRLVDFLTLSDNHLTNLNKLCPSYYLDVKNNKLTSLNLTNHTDVGYLDVSNNQLETLTLSKDRGYPIIAILNNNRLPFSQIDLNLINMETSVISPQDSIKIGDQIQGHKIDLSSMGMTYAIWYDSKGNYIPFQDYVTETDSVFYLLKPFPDGVYCKMYNENYKNLICTSKIVTIKPNQFKYAESDKEAIRKFIQQTSDNRIALGLTELDARLWNASESWIEKLKSFTWTQSEDSLLLEKINIHNNKWIRGAFNFASCSKLKEVILDDTSISSINLKNNKVLESVSIIDSYVNKIDLSGSENLKNLQVSQSELTSIDLSTNKQIKTLDLSENKLSSAKVASDNQLEKLNVSSNYFDFVNIKPLMDNINSTVYTILVPQAYKLMSSSYNVGDVISLSYIGGTAYRWFDKKWNELIEGVDYNITGGQSRFLREQTDSVRCQITNPIYPAMSLYTIYAKIVNPTHSIESSTLDEAVDVYSTQAGKIVIVAPVETEYAVYNLSGNLVTKGTTIETEETIDVLLAGVYLVKIEANNENVTKKVVVK